MARISEIMYLHRVEQPVLEITTKTTLQGVGQTIGSSFVAIMQYMEELGETMTDLPYVSFLDYETMCEDGFTIKVGFKTAKPLSSKGDIQSAVLPACKTVSALFMGGYSNLMEFYTELLTWIKNKGYAQDNISYEYYYTGPDVTENEHVTRIELPLK